MFSGDGPPSCFDDISPTTTKFNQPIGNWDVSSVIYMTEMFHFSNFNQPINLWCVSDIKSEPNGFSSWINFLYPFGDERLASHNKPIWGTCPQFTDLENGTVRDIDGKVYNTIQIGTQLWMSKNLRVSRFNDGTTIPEITLEDPVAWSTNNTGAWSYYDDDPENNSPFGKLYNFYVIDNEKNICPVGWKVPSDADWTALRTSLGSDAGKKLKSTYSWHSNGNGTNESGFEAVAAGRKGSSGTSYTELNQATRFWSSTENNENNGWIYRLTSLSDELQRDYNQKGNGFSIRCIYSEPVAIKTAPDVRTNDVEEIKPSTAKLMGEIVDDGGDDVSEAGFCYSLETNPDQTDVCVVNSATMGEFDETLYGLLPETTYYVRAFAKNSIGLSYGESVNFTTSRFECGDDYSDIEGKIYTTVQIGDQCWMSKNLRVTRFNDGTVIPEITIENPVAWSTNNTGAWSYYNDDPDNNTPYGKLYNFYVVDNEKNICPMGWKVPSDEEWTQLGDYLGSNAGRKLKTTYLWDGGGAGTDESGFSAIGAGRKGSSGTSYSDLNKVARFWSSTENNINNGWLYRLTYQSDELQRDYNQKGNGFSIRCMLDAASPVSIDEARAEIPTELELLQNYPNPFNPTTQIRFALPESQQVTIRVYDVNGRMGAELLDNVTYSAGNHQLTFDGAGLSSGIYIYTMRTSSGIIQSKKLLLMK
jgi:uncharacterized protein (TIGR02145 family)